MFIGENPIKIDDLDNGDIMGICIFMTTNSGDMMVIGIAIS